MTRVFPLVLALVNWAVAPELPRTSVVAKDVANQQQTRSSVEHEKLRVTETSKFLEIVFSKEPESRFFVHGTERFVAIAQPGKKTVAPSIDRVDHVTFVEADRLLTVEWRMSSGATEKATFRGLDRGTWDRLKSFVAAKVGSSLELREFTRQR